ncbi:MAG: 30S ribosomal protein S20 [Planctomycetes bacterium]|nr:30S ribosomal protein S20 [Planctomycetota bacterium]NUQ33763.1 30S ribosomal protein S20 [Planctomycetaceae bacterium]
MAHSNQARKRSRQNLKANEHNRAVRGTLRTEVKRLRVLIASGDKAKAEAQARLVESKADKAAKRNIIHSGMAARVKGRLKAQVAAMK